MQEDDPEKWFKNLSVGQKIVLAPVFIIAFFAPDVVIRIIEHLFHLR